MNKTWLLTIVLTLTLSICYGQTEKKVERSAELKNPKTNIKVNKEYDKNGNLIRYDSTYTCFYSNIENNKIIIDSMFNEFRDRFNYKPPLSLNSFFNDFFIQDSIFKENFFRNMERMEKMLRNKNSDSIKKQK